MGKIQTIKAFILTTGLMFLGLPILAATETIYPPLSLPFGKTLILNSESGTIDFILYFYALIVGMGAIIAVGMIIWAGVEIMMSDGDSSKVTTAKNKIMGAAIGLAVLFASYIILDVINTEFITPKLTKFDCEKTELEICIERISKSEEGKERTLVESSIRENTGLKSGEKFTIKKFNGLRELWAYPEINFNGKPKLIYRDENPLTAQDLKNPLPHEIEVDSTVQSVKVFSKIPGLYLYKDDKLPPVFVNKNSADLDFTGRVEIQNDVKGNRSLYALIFGNPNYNEYKIPYSVAPYAQCQVVSSLVGVNKVSMKSLMIFEEGIFNDNKPLQGGEMVVDMEDGGTITFYNNVKCGQGASQLKECETGRFPHNVNIDEFSEFSFDGDSAVCKGSLNGEKILSMRIEGSTGVILFDDSHCKYWDLESVDKDGNCVGYDNFLMNYNPRMFKLIPFKNKLN